MSMAVPGGARSLAALLAAAVSVGGCGSSWFGGGEDPPLPGERISVLALETALRPDPAAAGREILLPPPTANAEWPQAGGRADHAMQHLAAPGPLDRLWAAQAGAGSSEDGQLLAQPVVGGGMVFTMDAAAEIRAHRLETGAPVWRTPLAEAADEEGILGGGAAFDSGTLFVTTGFARVFALDAATGAEKWRRRLSGPLRAAPTVYRGRVFASTIANTLYALDAGDGEILWTHSGIAEAVGLVGAAAPAAADGIVVVPYSSGEVVALRAANGRMVWSDAVAPLRRSDPVSALPQIRGRPVIDRGLVLVVGNGGRTVAIDFRTGERVWEQAVGGAFGPWVAAGLVYVVSDRGEVVCLSRVDGRVLWVRALPRYEDEEDRTGAIQWTGPTLAGGRLLVGNSLGEIWMLSPRSGETLRRAALPSAVRIAPAVAGGTVVVLTESADLIALE